MQLRVDEFWHQHFGEVFFRLWNKMGFPDPHDYSKAYVQMREHRDLDTKWLREFVPRNGEIDLVNLRSVFGFGAVIGSVFADLLAVKEIHLDKIATWCGHFNLGISLYDYICDELGNFSSVISLESLQSFEMDALDIHRPSNSLEELLSKIVQFVLEDDQISEDSGSENRTLLFHFMQSLYVAENFVNRNNIYSMMDVKKIESALRTKSAGPFALIAQYCASTTSPGDREMLTVAKDMGMAMGHCYWLIDDARDLWDDLKLGHGNLFLLTVNKEDAELLKWDDGASDQQCLVDFLIGNKLAESFSGQFLEGLKKSLGMKMKNDTALGLVGASLWHWYMY